MSSRHYKIQLDDIFFTTTGDLSGTGCRIRVIPDIHKLLMSRVGSVFGTANNTPFFLTMNNLKKNVILPLTLEFCPTSIYESLVELFDETLVNQSSFSCSIIGETGNFSFNASPQPKEPITFGEFSNGVIKNVTATIVTV